MLDSPGFASPCDSGDLRFHVLLCFRDIKVAIDNRTTVWTRESPIVVLGSVQRCCDINMVVVVVVNVFVIPDEVWTEIPRRLLLVCPS